MWRSVITSHWWQRASSVTRARVRAALGLLALIAGLVLAHEAPALAARGSTAWFALAGAVCVVGAIQRLRLTGPALWLAAVCVGAGWYTLRIVEGPERTLASVIAPGSSVPVTVVGRLLDDCEPQARSAEALARFAHQEPAQRCRVEVEQALTQEGWSTARGVLWVKIAGAEPPAVRAGDRVRVVGLLRAVDGPRNPGEMDRRLAAAQAGVAGRLEVTSPSLVTLEPGGSRGVMGTLLRWRADAQMRARRVLDRAAGDEASAALLRGLVLGEYDPERRELRDAFARQGLAHVLSISGFHLAVMAGMLLAVLRLTGDRGWLEPVLVAALVLGYTAIVPASSPVIRSAAMVLVLLLAEACGRRYDRLTLLLWIACGLLLWKPLDVWSLGAQLSVGLTGLLLWAGGHFHEQMWGPSLRGAVPRARPVVAKLGDVVKLGVSSALMCWVAALPVLVLKLGLVSPLAVVTTVVVTPVIVLTLWVAYGALLVGVVAPPAADACAWLLSALSQSATKLVLMADAVPGSAVRVPPVSATWALAATVAACVWARFGNLRRARWWALASALVGWAGIEWAVGARLERGTVLRLDTLDVGDGTCHLVRSGEAAMLWDCGSSPAGVLLPGTVQACRALGAWKVEDVVVTHPDLDHFQSLPEVVGPLGVRSVLVSARFLAQAKAEPEGAAAALVRELAARDVRVEEIAAGTNLMLGTARVQVLSPPPGATWEADNDHSVMAVVRVATQAGERRMLLTGDAQDEAITALPALGPIEVVELPHHGSARPVAIEWVRGLAPSVVVQSSGPRRLDDVRWQPVRDAKPTPAWLVTARDGAVWVEVRETGLLRVGRLRTGS